MIAIGRYGYHLTYRATENMVVDGGAPQAGGGQGFGPLWASSYLLPYSSNGWNLADTYHLHHNFDLLDPCALDPRWVA
jgi:hypothetical protein